MAAGSSNKKGTVAMSNTHVTPYTFQTATIPLHDPIASQEAGFSGVHFTIQPDHALLILTRIESWFAGRDEIILVDEGACLKSGLPYIVMEWDNCEIDPLFLAILRDDEMINDFSVYFRSQEDYS
jgi:hypothetical protein